MRYTKKLPLAAGTLYFGDNLRILEDFIPSESVDLIYLDPPFNSKRNYNITYKGDRAQEHAFDDVWTWNQTEDELLEDLLVRDSSRIKMAEVMEALSRLLEKGDMLSYLVNMAVRLRQMHRVLKPTGSLYLHCDPTASHYLKIMLDVIFWPQNFRNEIIWKRSSAHSDGTQGSKRYGRIHDTLLFYSKSDSYAWNKIYTPYDQTYIDNFYKYVEPGTGRRYRLSDLTGPGGAAKGNPSYAVMGVTRYWRYTREKMDALISDGRVVQMKPGSVPAYKRYLDEMPGVPLQDVLTDVGPISSQAAERLGYPTQKPQALLERIILASSNPGDMILDPFCGCGTTVAAASKIGGRQWIGIDIAKVAIDVIQERLHNQGIFDFGVTGIPTDLASAQYLADKDKFAFERWAVKELGGYTPGRQSGDRGIDGKAHFIGNNGKPGTIIISVKGGANVNPSFARDLAGTVHRTGAELGVLIMLGRPTRGVRAEMNESGIYELNGKAYPVLQIVTAEDLVTGKILNLPDIGKEASTRPSHIQLALG